MTGSGSAVFGHLHSEAAARACMQQLEGKGRLYLARPLSRAGTTPQRSERRTAL